MAGTETKIDVAAIGKLAWTILEDSTPTVHAGDSDAVAVIPRGASPDDIHGPKVRKKVQSIAEWYHPETFWHKEEDASCVINIEWEAGGTYNGQGAYIRDALIYASDIDVPRGFRLESTVNFHGEAIDDNNVASLQFHVRVEGGSQHGRRTSYDITGSINGLGDNTLLNE